MDSQCEVVYDSDRENKEQRGLKLFGGGSKLKTTLHGAYS